MSRQNLETRIINLLKEHKQLSRLECFNKVGKVSPDYYLKTVDRMEREKKLIITREDGGVETCAECKTRSAHIDRVPVGKEHLYFGCCGKPACCYDFREGAGDKIEHPFNTEEPKRFEDAKTAILRRIEGNVVWESLRDNVHAHASYGILAYQLDMKRIKQLEEFATAEILSRGMKPVECENDICAINKELHRNDTT